MWSTSVDPFCGALGGEVYVATGTDWPVVNSWGIAGLFGLGRRAWTVMLAPFPQMSGHSMSVIVITNPLFDGSVWMAGTGVKACDPFSSLRFLKMPLPNDPAAGHVVIGSLPWGLLIQSRSDRVACGSLNVG